MKTRKVIGWMLLVPLVVAPFVAGFKMLGSEYMLFMLAAYGIVLAAGLLFLFALWLIDGGEK